MYSPLKQTQTEILIYTGRYNYYSIMHIPTELAQKITDEILDAKSSKKDGLQDKVNTHN